VRRVYHKSPRDEGAAIMGRRWCLRNNWGRLLFGFVPESGGGFFVYVSVPSLLRLLCILIHFPFVGKFWNSRLSLVISFNYPISQFSIFWSSFSTCTFYGYFDRFSLSKSQLSPLPDISFAFFWRGGQPDFRPKTTQLTPQTSSAL
jgi:hypothetical protein